MRAAFKKFTPVVGENAATFEPAHIDRELESTPPSARNAHLRIVKATFHFAVKKGWVKTNPVSRVDFAEIDRGEVVVLSNEETARLLTACNERDPALLPNHLFGLFTGIRPAELERMKWEHVHLDERHIMLPSEE